MAIDPIRYKVRVISEHTETETDYHEWISVAWANNGYFYGDTLGRRNGGMTRWVEYVCNNPDCAGEAWVAESEIEKVVGVWIDEAIG